MGKIKRVLRCYNCGAVLQSKSKEENGFVPQKVLDNNSEDLVIYCQRCFDKMRVINSGALDQHIDDETFKILDDARATDATIIWVVDLFNFNGTISPELVKKVKKLDLEVIATKKDLFPRNATEATLQRYIQERFNEVGLNPTNIRVIGNTNEISLDEIINANEARKGHDIYIIGSLSSGKTFLINKLLKTYTNKTKWQIKTEAYPGTTQKVMSIPLTNSTFVYELPGFSLATSVAGKVEKDILRLITPKKKVEVSSHTLRKGHTFVIGSLGAFQLCKGKITAFKFYHAEGVETKSIGTKDFDTFLFENSKRAAIRPVSEHFTNFKDFDLFEYDMENDGQLHDISITGLGWVTFEARGQTIRVAIPRGVAVKESLAKIRK